MSFPSDDTILNKVVQIKEVQHMKASANSPAIHAAILGVSAAVGGLLGGRMGFTLGTAVSTALLASYLPRDGLSLPRIINYMTREVKATLVKAIRELAIRIGVEIMTFLTQIPYNEFFLACLLELLTNFLASVIDMHVQCIQ